MKLRTAYRAFFFSRTVRPAALFLLVAFGHHVFGASSPELQLTSLQKPLPGQSTPPKESLEASVLRIPLHFEESSTETGPASYRASGPGFSFSVASSQVEMDLRIATPRSMVRDQDAEAQKRAPSTTRAGAKAIRSASKRVTMDLVAAKSDAKPLPRKPMTGKVNHFTGGNPAQWRQGLSLFEAVSFKEVYRGIDVVYYGTQAQLEYDFVVAPGADPSAVRLRFSGINRLSVDHRGDLVLSIEEADIRHHAPYAYQELNGRRVSVPARYSLVSENGIQFGIGDYDHALPLVIDPVLSYASYLGGTAADRSWSAAVDGLGNLYVVGETFSPSLPGLEEKVRSSYGGGNSAGGDAFLAKVNMQSNLLEYFTYLGGTGQDGAFGVALDGSGNIFVTGYTGSTNFPTTNAVQPKIAGTAERRSGFNLSDAFVAKFDPSGTNLLYCTYLGGSGEDEGLSVAVDASGAAYVAGQTSSTNFPVFHPIMGYQAGDDAFIAKLDPTGRALVYSTTLGGEGVDSAEGIVVDNSGRATVAGLSTSTNFPVRAAFQSTNAGHFDAVIFRMDPSGSALEYSTYFGGENDDYGVRLQLDSKGQPIVTGQTYSTNFPALRALQSTNGGSGDAFVSKFASDGQSLMFSTYLGGTGVDQAWDIAVDARDNIYFAGSTSSINFPIADAFQTNLFGFQDAFIASISGDGSRLIYSSYYGGPDNEQGLGLAVEPGGTAYLVGRTFSTASLFPLTNVFQPNFGGGGNDSFVARITTTPRLSVQSANGTVEISWPVTHPSYALEVKEGLQRVPGWERYIGPQTSVGGSNIVQLPAIKAARFYRLVQTQ